MKSLVISLINVFGLSIGIAFFILTMVYVMYENSYDDFHHKTQKVYTAMVTIDFENFFVENSDATPATFARIVKEEYPEVLEGARLTGGSDVVFRYGDKKITETEVKAADSNIFNVFPYRFIYGDPKNALNEPNTIVLTEKLAKKYFGDINPLGKIIETHFDKQKMKVTGVIENPPKNSIIHFNALFSMVSIDSDRINDPMWMNNNYRSYFLLHPKADYKELEAKLPALMKKQFTQFVTEEEFDQWFEKGNRWEYSVHSLQEVYLDVYGNRVYVVAFSLFALFLILVAIINYINLYTAKASKRSREVGIRKVVGANKNSLIIQFILESVLISIIALILAMGIVESILPWLSEFLDKNLRIEYFQNPFIIPSLLLTAIVIGVISGIYPALVLSSYKPAVIVKGKILPKSKNLNFRNVLVILQFAFSVFFIIGVITVNLQSNLLITKNLGFDKSNVLVLSNTDALEGNFKEFKTELLEIPEVNNASYSSRVPGITGGPINQFTPEAKAATLMSIYMVDEDFLETMDIKLKQGRFFEKEFLADSAAVVVNEATMNLLNWGDTVNKTINGHFGDHTVVGIVEDFHYMPLNDEIDPMIICKLGGIYQYEANYILIRLNPGHHSETIAKVESIWNSFVKDAPFEYFFLDNRYTQLYDTEQQMSKLILILTLLILIISGLGLYGLAAFTAEENMKEISIRKALGASVYSLMKKFSWNFTKLVLIANIIAWPVSWYLLNNWLNNFASRIDMYWWIFILATTFSVFFALITIATQAYITAKKNPVKVLNYE